MADRQRNTGNKGDERVPRGDHEPQDASGRSEGGFGSGREQSRSGSSSTRGDESRTGRSGSSGRDDSLGENERGMGAREGGDQNRSDRLSGRSSDESDLEERNSGSRSPDRNDGSSRL